MSRAACDRAIKRDTQSAAARRRDFRATSRTRRRDVRAASHARRRDFHRRKAFFARKLRFAHRTPRRRKRILQHFT